MTTRQKIEADRAKTRNRLELTVIELYVAEAIAEAVAIRDRAEPTPENRRLRWATAAEAKSLRRQVAIDLLCLAALGLAGEADRMKREIYREVKVVRAASARAATQRALAN